jgi:hypothetical protein
MDDHKEIEDVKSILKDYLGKLGVVY